MTFGEHIPSNLMAPTRSRLLKAPLSSKGTMLGTNFLIMWQCGTNRAKGQKNYKWK